MSLELSDFENSEASKFDLVQLQKFYESHGFIKTSDMYLEDDIEHIEMKKA